MNDDEDNGQPQRRGVTNYDLSRQISRLDKHIALLEQRFTRYEADGLRYEALKTEVAALREASRTEMDALKTLVAPVVAEYASEQRQHGDVSVGLKVAIMTALVVMFSSGIIAPIVLHWLGYHP